ncbi:MAG: MFS transporter [Candidatus Njordarchaeales archaeon]
MSLDNISDHRKMGFIQVTLLFALSNFATYILIPNFNLIKQELGVSDTYLGILMGGFLFFNGLGALLWSYLSDARGAKRKILLTLSFILSGLLIYIVSVTKNTVLLMFSWILAGACLGATVPLGFSIISDLFPPENRTQTFMLWFFFSGFGLAFGYGFSLFLGAFYNWRFPVMVGSFIVALSGSILSMTLWEPPKGWSDIKGFGGVDYPYRFRISDLKLIARNKTNIFIVIQGFFGTIPNGALSSWAVHYLVREWGLSEIMASTILAMGSVGAIGGFFFSYLGDKLYERNEMYRPLIAAVCSIVEGLLFAIFFMIPVKLDIYTNDLIEGFIIFLDIIRKDPTSLLAMVIFFTAMAMNPAPGSIRESVLSDANLPEHRATVLAGANIIEIFSKSLSITVIGILSDLLGSLKEPLTIVMLIWILSGIAWIYVAKYYGEDKNNVRKVITKRLQKSNQ